MKSERGGNDLHLETAAHGVERIGHVAGGDGRSLRAGELGQELDDLVLGLLVPAQACARTRGVCIVSATGFQSHSADPRPHHTTEDHLRVVGDQRVVDAEVGAAERDDPDHRDPETLVQVDWAALSRSGLLNAVAEAAELALARADVGGEAGTGVIKWVPERMDRALRGQFVDQSVMEGNAVVATIGA